MKKNKFAILLLAILAVSSLSFVAGAYATPFMSWNTVPNKPSTPSYSPPSSPPPTPSYSPPSTQFSFKQNCVRMDGNITEWETTPTETPVLGMIEAQSRTTVGSTTTRQGFSATAIWTTNLTRPIAAFRTLENFTYTFYAARLVQGISSVLEPTSTIAWNLTGTWNVWNITTYFTVITGSSGIVSVTTTHSIVSLAKEAVGNLTVASGWQTFTLTIGKIPSLTGTVICYRISSGMFNPFIVSCGTSNTVTPADLNSIANAYGSMPGWGNYNLRLDPCLDFKVDIYDLSTAAANLNSP